MFTKHTEYRYGMPYTVPFVITQCLTNGTVTLQCGEIEIRYNIRCMNPYKSDTKVKDFS